MEPSLLLLGIGSAASVLFILVLLGTSGFWLIRRRRQPEQGQRDPAGGEEGRIYQLFKGSIFKEDPDRTTDALFRVILQKYGEHWRDYREFIPRILAEEGISTPRNFEEQLDFLASEMLQESGKAGPPRPIHLTVNDIDRFTPIQFRGLIEKTMSKMGYRPVQARDDTLLLERNLERVVVCLELREEAVDLGSLEKALGLLAQHNCTGAFLVSNREFVPECLEEAADVSVELVDRRMLQDWLDEYVNEETPA